MADQFAPLSFRNEAVLILRSTRLSSRAYTAVFGVNWTVTAMIWRKLVRDKVLPENARRRHLLWALAFLKQYASWDALASSLHCSNKSMRDWVWLMVEALQYMDVVSRV